MCCHTLARAQEFYLSAGSQHSRCNLTLRECARMSRKWPLPLRCFHESRRAITIVIIILHPSVTIFFFAPTIHWNLLGARQWASLYHMVESGRLGFKSQPHSGAGWCWASGFSSLSFSFFKFEMETIIQPAPRGWSGKIIWAILVAEFNEWLKK